MDKSMNIDALRGEPDGRLTVTDIFSWLPGRELSLEEIECAVLNGLNGETERAGLIPVTEPPAHINENIVNVAEELKSENKMVCYLLKDATVIAVAGYRET